ncbi:hypothetical protein HPY26_21190 [Methylorubrum rhodesianum]|uniref:Uncharacterized protein n=1 Tax=Methylorubrum rhodesianum TaxID=29427 RepID=A0ABU9Z4Q1_9HYPH|nr:hypothetical protein [Methylorubrum rhodesianum]MBK3405246.1 hypothetical protein [Methylorubrum rhodesianum]
MVADSLDAEALAHAAEVDIVINPTEGSVNTWVLQPEHIVATALKVGRAKDRSRILQFLEEDAVDLAALHHVQGRHDLVEKWQSFCQVVGIEDHRAVGSKAP